MMTVVTNTHLRKRTCENITNAELRKFVNDGWYIRDAWTTESGYVIDFEKVLDYE